MWTGGYACPGEKVALLCCLATGGYHSCSSYQWSLNDNLLPDECHAITFVTCCGCYTCAVTTVQDEKHTFLFEVQGNAILV